MKVTMLRDDWVFVSRGFDVVEDATTSQKIIDAVKEQGPNDPGPLTIDLSDMAAMVIPAMCGPVPFAIGDDEAAMERVHQRYRQAVPYSDLFC